ncbi:DUF4352 domain-containing protein [Streptomyces sp. 378]|uniref:DUF4352 domain-containing protein n=1 Tax=Streptomyces sp. 378 TaxID=3049412 RepID=UPI0024C22D2F|nr:DUF4352 domain-containing protein [Streptomyces sp. 378]MDK1344184.1 DUF4352 domain-containing protein [Streptomyces sp. 378]
MRHTITALAACLLLAGTVSCSSNGDDSKPTVAKASETQSASPTPSPSPSPSRETLKLGDTADIDAEGKLSAATRIYKDEGIPDVVSLLNADQKWAALEVKVCNKGPESITVTPFVWSLAYADGARVEATHMTGNELPQPLYPVEAKVKVGDCVRGNVLFQAPKKGRPERVLYSPDALDEPVEWTVPKA